MEKEFLMKTIKKTAATGNKPKGLSEGERASIKARVQELKAEAEKADGDKAALAAIAKMPAPYRAIGKRLHALIKASAPTLAPKTWYGLPAYARDDKVVCYLRMNPGAPYNDRYLMVGFSEQANLDDGALWPIVFALKELTAAGEAKIAALVKKAVS
jgi:uncharacterized protein YdhG (YjbR/CyaY superfamily)